MSGDVMGRVRLSAMVIFLMALGLLQGLGQATIDGHSSPQGEKADVPLILFSGTLLEFHDSPMAGAPHYWTVKVDKVLAGPKDIGPSVTVITFQAVPPPWGKVEPGLQPNDKVWAFGTIRSDGNITLIGSQYYFLEKGPKEIEVEGTALAFHKYGGFGNGSYWTVKVDRVICGPWPCSGLINVTTCAPIPTIPWGCSDPGIKRCSKVAVFGTYHTLESLSPGDCGIWLFGSKKYFMEGLH
jgi:hypothetical protein